VYAAGTATGILVGGVVLLIGLAATRRRRPAPADGG
jgi:hypothetical protein